jgi:hypothetical protein
MGVTYIRLYASVLCFGRSNLAIRKVWVVLGMDSDRIRTDTNSKFTIYHILF